MVGEDKLAVVKVAGLHLRQDDGRWLHGHHRPGTPATSVDKGTAYSFTPTANDADGDALVFAITNQPSWASFNTTTGALSGTPLHADVGLHAGIVISVSDNVAAPVALAAFAINVVEVTASPAFLSDDFNSCALDTNLRTLVDPLGDGSVSLIGAGTPVAQLLLSVPGGASHKRRISNES